MLGNFGLRSCHKICRLFSITEVFCLFGNFGLYSCHKICRLFSITEVFCLFGNLGLRSCQKICMLFSITEVSFAYFSFQRKVRSKKSRSEHVCNFKNEFFCLFPAEARVGDGFSVHAFAYFLSAVFKIAFYHKTFYHVFYFCVLTAGGKHFL